MYSKVNRRSVIGCIWKWKSRRQACLSSDFVVVCRIAPDEETLILSKPVVQFYFTYGVSRGIFIVVYTSITSFFFYCIIRGRIGSRFEILIFHSYKYILIVFWIILILLFDTICLISCIRIISHSVKMWHLTFPYKYWSVFTYHANVPHIVIIYILNFRLISF